MKLAFFGYAWGPGGRLDAYMQEVVNAYLGLGFDVDVFLGNYFVAEPPTFGIRDAELLGRLVRNVRAGNYVAAVSMNNALVAAPVVDALEGRVTSVIVDGFNHLFRYDADDRFAAFRLPAHFAPIGSQFERDILAAVPDAGPRVTFLSPATNGMHFPRAATPIVHPISWIASLTTGERAETLMRQLMGDPLAHGIVRACLTGVAETAGREGGGLQRAGHRGLQFPQPRAGLPAAGRRRLHAGRQPAAGHGAPRDRHDAHVTAPAICVAGKNDIAVSALRYRRPHRPHHPRLDRRERPPRVAGQARSLDGPNFDAFNRKACWRAEMRATMWQRLRPSISLAGFAAGGALALFVGGAATRPLSQPRLRLALLRQLYGDREATRAWRSYR